MAQIGDITIPDNLMPTAVAPGAGERPGLGALFGNALQQAYGQVRYGVPYAIEKALGTAGATDEQFYQQGLNSTRRATDAIQPASIEDVTSGRVGIGRFIAENLVTSAPQTLAGIAGAVVGGRLAGPEGALAGATGVNTPLFVGSNVDRAVAEEGKLTDSAAYRSIFTAPFQAASDALVERYLPGAGHVAGEFAATQTGNFLARTAKSIVKAGATEAVAEAGQQLGERYAAGLDVTGPQAAAEYVNAAVTAFAVGGVLGAGGGFRRLDAHAKPAGEVTTDDLNTAIDAGLSPQKPALTPVANPQYQPPRLLLTDQRVQEPIVTGADGVSVTPQQRDAALSPDILAPQNINDFLAGQGARLDAARALAQQAEAVGGERDRVNSTIRDILAGRGQDGNIPEALRAPAPAFDPAAALQSRLAQGGLQGSTSPLAIDASGDFNGTANLPEVRTFATEPIADLHAAVAAKSASPEVKAEAEREIAQRTAEATGQAPLTTDNFQQRVDEVKQGLRNQFIAKLTATDPADLLNKVYDRVLVDQDTSANTIKLAQRVGLLDADLNPTATANAIEAQRTQAAQAEVAAPVPVPVQVAANAQETTPAGTPAVPVPVSIAQTTVDPQFKQQLGLLSKDAGVDASRLPQAVRDAPNLQVAQAAVFQALGNDTTAPRGSEASRTEKLAQKMGLITDDDARDITPLGRKVYFGTDEGLRDVAAAAAQQGYTGAQQSIFNQGVQAVVSGQEAAGHTSFEDMAAYQAGKVFAQDFVDNGGTATAAQSNAITYRKGTERAQGSTPAAGRGARENVVERTQLTPGQIQQRGLNRLLDAADLRTAPDGDVAQLRRMVRDGASPEEVGRALQQVQGGQTLFKQPPTEASTLSPAPTRGQPIFKELNTETTRTPSKAQSRVDNEEAVRTFTQRQAIRQALLDKEIPVARADKLNDMLDEGRIAQVERLTKDFGSIKRDANGRAAFGKNQFGYADARLERELTGKTFAEAAQHMIDNAPSAYSAAVMKQVLAISKQIEAAGGHSLELRIVRPGDSAPRIISNPDLLAYTTVTHNPSRAVVWLKSAELSPEVGVNYQMAAHEMLHAVTMEALEYARESDPDGKTKLGRAARDLRDLATAIQRHVNARLDNISRNALDAKSLDEQRRVELELQHALGEHNVFADPHEILAWGLTNPDVQRYLQSIEYKPRQSVFSRLVSLVRDLLGLGGQKYDTALTELMRVSEQVLGSNARELAPVFGSNDPNFGDERVLSAAAGARTISDSNDVTQQVASTISGIADRVNVADLGVKTRRLSLGIFSQNHLDREFGAKFPGMLARSDAKRQHDAIRGRFTSMGDQAYQRFEGLQRSDPSQAEKLGRLMALTTEFKIDPDKAFEQHTHLQDDPNIGALRRLYAEAQKMKNDLSRGDGAGYRLYGEFRAWNEAMNYARLATELHSLVALDPEFALGVSGASVNPMDTFMATADLSEAGPIRDHWQQALNDQLKAAMSFVNLKKGQAAAGTPADVRATAQHLSPIDAKIASTHEALAGMARSPYFHLGRFGDNFGSATIRKLENGTVDPKAQAHVAQALHDAGFTNVQISADNTRPKFSARFDTVDQTNRFKQLMLSLHEGGWLDGEIEDIKTGPRDRADNFGVAPGMPSYVHRYIQAIEQSPTFVPEENATPADRIALEQRKQEAIQLARDTWLEQQPDSAISKVLTARYTVPGYDPDMIRNFAHRWNVGSTSLAGVATSAKLGNAYRDMRAQANEARSAGNKDDPYLLSDLLTEVQKRDATNPINPTAGAFDKLRSISHAYYLGLSPAYGAIQLMQVGTNALPELAKTHGYAQSFHAIRRASTAAFALMKAATAEAAKGGWQHYADVALTEPALKAAGLSQVQTDFVRRMIATGSIDIGQSANALSQIARNGTGSKLDVALKYASAIGLHTETFSRLVTALAAADLHKGDTASKAAYAQKVVSNSMFDYQSWNTARALGKQGFAGPVTPLLTQFMTYSAQMTEKLYSEAHDAIGRQRDGETAEQAAERRSASRTFLLGHLTAITALAGTLGLPFASVFATAIERLVGGATGEPYDATAAWRNFLASVLGKDVGEVVARGAPRALGFDISQRVGESDLLPFSQLLGDRRSWRESIQSTLGRSTGAAPDMLLNVADAGTAFSNGDVLGGMKSLLPVAFKGPTEAYRMSSEGYVDSKGNKLPMTPTAADILYQLLGFTPADKAEYSEARGDQQSRRVALNQEAAGLRTRIVKALTSGDTAGASRLIQQAQTFDAANPSFAVIPSLQGAVQRQAQSQARARALGTPLGVPVTDIAGQNLTRYANVNYQ